ncbi:hypothetical protein [Streptomyces sp. NWU49]|uniref:hypothetical protein n=1 Tax=Streptomyces sp. NWU49 TaxID=2201153 RepID=UPI0011B837C0|nr:hypothetical protein [Streptomyces sp. NWU49]
MPLIVALALAGVGVYAAYRDPKLGTALLVGFAIITVLYVIWEKDPTVFETDSPPSSTVPTQVVSPNPEVAPPSPPADVSPAASLPPSPSL